MPEEIFRWIVSGGLFAAFCSVGRFLDNNLKTDVKLYASKFLSWPLFKAKFSEIFENCEKVFEFLFYKNNFRKFIFKSFLVSLFSMTIILIIQKYIRPKEFNDVTLPFIQGLMSFNVFSIAGVMGFIVTDIISIYATFSFLRLLKYCKDAFDYIFVAVADLAISLMIGIFVVPLFILFAQSTRSAKDIEVVALISNAASKPQAYDFERIGDLLLVDSGENQISRESFKNKFSSFGWNVSSFNVSFILLKDSNREIAYDASNLYMKSEHSFNVHVQRKNKIEERDIFNFYIVMLKNSMNIYDLSISEISPEESYPNYAIIKLKAKPNAIKIDFSYYLSLVQSINYFGTKFPDLVKLSRFRLSENDAVESALVNGNISSKSLNYVKCDEIEHKVESFVIFVETNNFKNCINGIGISGKYIDNFSNFAMYNIVNPHYIPISPFIMPSVFLTFIYYLFLIIFILYFLTLKLIEKYFDIPLNLLNNNAFTVIFALIGVTLVMLSYLLVLLFR